MATRGDQAFSTARAGWPAAAGPRPAGATAGPRSRSSGDCASLRRCSRSCWRRRCARLSSMDATSRRRPGRSIPRRAVRPTTTSSSTPATAQAPLSPARRAKSAIPLVRAFMPPPPAWDAARPASARRPARAAHPARTGTTSDSRSRPRGRTAVRPRTTRSPTTAPGSRRSVIRSSQPVRTARQLSAPVSASTSAAAVAQRGAMPRQAGRQQIVAGPKPPAACRGHAFQRVEQAGIDAERQPRSAMAAASNRRRSGPATPRSRISARA